MRPQNKLLNIVTHNKKITKPLNKKVSKLNLKPSTSEEKYKNIYDNALEGMFRTSIEGKSLQVNPALASMLGFNSVKETINYINISDSSKQVWSNPDDRLIYTSLLNHNKIVKGFETKLKRKDGSNFWVSLNARIVYDEVGNKLYYEGFIIDINARKIAEAENIFQLLRYKTLMQTSQDAIHILDETGKLIECNEAFIKHLGYSEEETSNLHVWDWDMQWNKKEVQKIIAEVPEKGITFETVHKIKDGSTRNMEISLHKVSVNNNILFYSSGRDITERKLAEIQLKKITKAIEQSPASIVITDLNASIEYVNPAFTALTGYSYKEAIGKNPRILKSDITPPSTFSKLWQNLTNGIAWHGELCNRKKNGEIYWEQAIISPVTDDKGEITNYVAVKENITDRKRLGEEQKQMVKIIENTTACVSTADLNRNIIYANKAYKKLFGIDDKDDIKKYNTKIFRTKEGEIISKEINKALQEKGIWIGENIYKSLTGQEINVWQVVVIHEDEKGIPSLMSTTAIDISKIKVTEKKLQIANKELRNLSEHLQEISELEKKEISREIHDELGQNLTALNLNISWLKKHMDDNKSKVEKILEDLSENIKETMEALRRIQSSLHPAMLEDSGLYKTVEWLIKSSAKSVKIPINFSSNLENVEISFNKSLALYRVIQESLTNIMRYAKASKVLISLMKHANTLILNIEDDGCGFDVTKVDTKLHHGLLGIRERVYAINGKFNINSVSGYGTSINVEVPV